MNRIEHAVSLFKQEFSCSQAILTIHGIEFRLDYEIALKLASTFGGGIARMGEICGAVTGAIMVIGLKFGRTIADDEDTKLKSYRIVEEFINNFKRRNKSIICRELLGYDISKPEFYEIVEAKKIVEEKCPKYVQDSSEILEELLNKR